MATVTKPIALDESINTTEQTPRNIADVLAEELKGIADNILPPNASQIAYDNTVSGLTATNVQDAIDEVISSQSEVIADTMADLTENKTATVTDGVADFETIDGSLVKSLVVEIEPNPNGYTQADVTVVGKNRLPLTLTNLKAWNTRGSWSGNVYTDSTGFVFTVSTDGDAVTAITASGSGSNNGVFFVCSDSELNGTFTVNGCPSGGSWGGSNPNTYRIRVGNYGSSYKRDNTGGDTTDTFTNGIDLQINIGAGYTPNNLVFKPMVRLATDTDSTFEPYHGKTYTTTFGQSITAGGTLDFLTGELTTGGQTISLTPQTVKALAGENHIMASTGDVTECKFSMLINGDDLEMLLS